MELIDLEPAPGGVRIVPSVAIMKGNPVRVKEGRYHPFKDPDGRIGWADLFKTLSGRYSTIHYLDIGGISSQDVDLDILRGITSFGSEIWADTGIAYSEMVIDAIMAGATEAVLSTRSITSLDEIALAFELSENIVIQVDVEEGKVMARDPTISSMEAVEFLREMSELGLTRFILVGMDTKGQSGMATLSEVRSSLRSGSEIYISVESLDGIEALKGMVEGVIISSSQLIEGIG